MTSAGTNSTSTTTVAIVEDSTAVSTSLEKVLAETGQYICICTCANGEQALRMIPQKEPEVVLMDIELPDISGIECTARLKRLLPDVQILILTVYKNSDLIFKALEAGASGYLLKRSTSDEILRAIRDVKEGGAPMSSEIARKVVQSFRKQADVSPELASLTRREEEILSLLAQGYASKEIGDKLAITYDTVCSHLRHIYDKLHVRSRTAAVIKYLR
jgi:DNA-binding NarL/FixJ family response regulator